MLLFWTLILSTCILGMPAWCARVVCLLLTQLLSKPEQTRIQQSITTQECKQGTYNKDFTRAPLALLH